MRKSLVFLLLLSINIISCDDSSNTGDSNNNSCADGEVLCGDLCTTTSDNPQHCGVCDNSCSDDETCIDGQCTSFSTCTPQNCTGCCDGDTCKTGDSSSACGSNGIACVQCSDGECENNGSVNQCTTSSCSPDNCSTCCTSNGTCVSEASDAQCGTRGEECVSCSSNSSCTSGACVPDSCLETCNGCCLPDGTCINHLDANVDDQCGKIGGLCENCADYGANWVCSAGGCITETCQETCTGCCNGDTCVSLEEQDDANCRHLDSWELPAPSCTDCGPLVCQEQPGWERHVCYLDAQSVSIYLLDGEMPEFDEEGDSWDPIGLPDPFVTLVDVYSNGTAGSPVMDDTLSPDWSDNPYEWQFDTFELWEKEFYVIDEDSAVHDIMFWCDPNMTMYEWDRKHLISAFIDGEVQECIDSDTGGIIRYRAEINY